jgi:hypothetical protein
MAGLRRIGWVAAFGLVALVGGLLSWRIQHAGDPPSPAAAHRHRLADLPVVALWPSSHFMPPPGDGTLPSSSHVPSAAIFPVQLTVDGQPVDVALDARQGALCTSLPGERARCRAGAMATHCSEACEAGDGVLGAAGDLVLTDWSTGVQFERWTVRARGTRLWRVTLAEPVPLIELDVAAEPDRVWIDPAAGVEFVTALDGGGWQIIGCGLDGSCRRTETLNSYPAVRSALRATPAADLEPSGAWPSGVTLTLASCQVLWPPALDVRGVITGTGTLAVPLPADAGLLVVDILRPDTVEPAQVPLDVTIMGDGAFSLVLDNPPMGFIHEPPVLRQLLDTGRCQLRLRDPSGGLSRVGDPIRLS